MYGPLLVHVKTPPFHILPLLVIHILLKAICLASSADYLTSFAIAPLPQNIFAQAASSRRTTTSFTLITLLFDAMEMVPSSKQSMSKHTISSLPLVPCLSLHLHMSLAACTCVDVKGKGRTDGPWSTNNKAALAVDPTWKASPFARLTLNPYLTTHLPILSCAVFCAISLVLSLMPHLLLHPPRCAISRAHIRR